MKQTPRKQAAGRNGSKNSATAPAPAATNGANGQPTRPADSAFEQRLAEMLKDVPPFIRLPKPGARCQFTQLSRGAFYELIAPSERNEFRPAVRAIYRKARRGARRGIWLVPASNLVRHLLTLEADSSERFLADSQERAARRAEKGPAQPVASDGAETPGEPEPQAAGGVA